VYFLLCFAGSERMVERMVDRCGGCGARRKEVDMFWCADCRQVTYCDVGCQRLHWPIHKINCRKYMQSVEIRGHRISAMDNGIYAIKPVNAWEMVLTEPSLVSFTSDDYDDFVEMGSQPTMMLVLKLARMPGFHPKWFEEHSFLQKRFPPGHTAATMETTHAAQVQKIVTEAAKHGHAWISPAYVLNHIYPLTYNYDMICYEFMSGEVIHFGSALYWYASLLNHSCNPNCIALVRPNSICIVATRPIAVDEEITISYRPCLSLSPLNKPNKLNLKRRIDHCLCFHPNCLFKPPPPPTCKYPKNHTTTPPTCALADKKKKKKNLPKVDQFSAFFNVVGDMDGGAMEDEKYVSTDKKWFEKMVVRYSLAARAWLTTAKPTLDVAKPTLDVAKPTLAAKPATIVSAVDQIQWLIFDLMKEGWNAVSNKMKMDVVKLHDILTEWVILLLPDAKGEAKLRLAVLGTQLYPSSPQRLKTLLQLSQFISRQLCITSRILTFSK
jgi:hypothetical protein